MGLPHIGPKGDPWASGLSESRIERIKGFRGMYRPEKSRVFRGSPAADLHLFVFCGKCSEVRLPHIGTTGEPWTSGQGRALDQYSFLILQP